MRIEILLEIRIPDNLKGNPQFIDSTIAKIRQAINTIPFAIWQSFRLIK